MVNSKKTVVVTGGNTGQGLQCCLALAKTPNMHVILAGRSPQRVNDAVAKVRVVADPTSEVEAGIVDLASLASVREFAQSLLTKQLSIFAIVCNAGLQLSSKELTVDGFERTFGVSHLGHFLLVNLLRERTQRVVMVSSEVHDPAERWMVPAPDVSDLDQLARGYDKYDGGVAYSTSKLCNLVFAREFAQRFPTGPEILSFGPGLMLDTEFARFLGPYLFAVAAPILRLQAWWIGGRCGTSENSGGWLARLATDEPLPLQAKSGAYVRVDELYEPSALSKDPVLGKELWEKSVQWVGL